MGKPKGNRRLSDRERVKRGGEPARRGSAPRTGMARDVGAVVLLAAAAAGALSLATFSSLDGALIARGMSPANLCGPVGHRVASALYGVLGFSFANSKLWPRDAETRMTPLRRSDCRAMRLPGLSCSTAAATSRANR